MTGPDQTDVIIVGAGPAGATAAAYLAKAGLGVVVLEKAEYPREKVCGDGLTPRAVAELARLGVDTAGLGWARSRGLRIHVGRAEYRLDWPTLPQFPNFGLVCRRSVFDQYLAGLASAAGADVRFGTTVAGPLRDQRGRVVGVTTTDGQTLRAPVVLAADGNSARLAVGMGLDRLPNHPLGVAVRTYFASPLGDTDWLDSWLELWDGPPNRSHLLPGYAWSFPLGDGVCNVGLGLPDAARFRGTDYRDLLRRWLATVDPELGLTPQRQTEAVVSAALPMGFARRPLVLPGLLLLGDAAGLINPFNGEGISYAMESGRFAAEAVVAAYGQGIATRTADRELRGYGTRLTAEWGRYFWLGNHFSRIISHPTVMRLSAHAGLPIPVVRQLVHRLLAHLWADPPRDGYDWVCWALTHIAPRD